MRREWMSMLKLDRYPPTINAIHDKVREMPATAATAEQRDREPARVVGRVTGGTPGVSRTAW